MNKNFTDIPVESDIKILEYASKKNFRKKANIYRFIVRIAAVFAFAATVLLAVELRPKEQETVSLAAAGDNDFSLDDNFEKFYTELTMCSDSFEENYESLNEKLNEELQDNFYIAYTE